MALSDKKSWWWLVPAALAAIYFAFFASIFFGRLFWSIGDATDVFVPALAAAPWGLLTFFFPGDRNAAFVFVFLMGTLNTFSIWFAFTKLIEALAENRVPPETDPETQKQ